MFKNAILLLIAVSPLLPAAAQDGQPVQAPAPEVAVETAAAEVAPAAPTPLPEGIAARALNDDGTATLITFAELDALLVARHGKRAEGQDVLARLLNMKVLHKLAADAGVEISSKQLDDRIAEINQKLLDQGYEGGLAAQLVASDISPEIFRSTFAVSLAMEELARLALGQPEGERPGPGQQEAWMKTMMEARGGSLNNDPFPTKETGIAATSGDVTVTMAEFYEHLRDELPRQFVEQSCTQMILEKRLRAKAGTIEDAEWQAAVDLEISRRRARHNANPETQGVSYEALLDAQGMGIAGIKKDPAVVVTALTSVLSWRDEVAAAKAAGSTATDVEELRNAGRRALYEEERELFDGYYGERLHLAACVLRSAEVPDEVVTRTTEEAHAYLGRLAPGIPDAEGFRLIVGKLSDDAGAKENGGELGWFGRGDERLPQNIRDAAFDYWAAKGKDGVAGPIDVVGGVAILWVGPLQPAPEWELLSQAVQSELQARTLSAAMPPAGIQIFRDPPLTLPNAPAAPEAPKAE